MIKCSPSGAGGLKSYKPISRILSWAIIYLFPQLPVEFKLPTLYRVRLSADLGRAVLRRYYMWHFSMQGLPANDVTIKSRRLLPYVFTIALRSLGEGG